MLISDLNAETTVRNAVIGNYVTAKRQTLGKYTQFNRLRLKLFWCFDRDTFPKAKYLVTTCVTNTTQCHATITRTLPDTELK